MAADCSRKESSRVIAWARGELGAVIAALPEGSQARACHQSIVGDASPPAAEPVLSRERSREDLMDESDAFMAATEQLAMCRVWSVTPSLRQRLERLIDVLLNRSLVLKACSESAPRRGRGAKLLVPL